MLVLVAVTVSATKTPLTLTEMSPNLFGKSHAVEFFKNWRFIVHCNILLGYVVDCR
jgi:hypothetical protein